LVLSQNLKHGRQPGDDLPGHGLRIGTACLATVALGASVASWASSMNGGACMVPRRIAGVSTGAFQ